MFKQTSALKLISYLASAALLGFGIFTFGLPFGHQYLGAFALGNCALLLAGMIRDYAPRRARWEPTPRVQAVRFPTRSHVIRRRVPALVAAV
ncbi:MAG: hypothetical protein KBF26_05255 [Opitutaceae bacterium]|nr:hypothetical protein [Opitutaceae bacterium]